LFATLDTTIRRLQLTAENTVLISDTVGFIRKLPHHLIASFQTTLAQTIEADILLHIIDLNHMFYADHIEVVRDVLKDLKIDNKPTFLIMNKVDRIDNQEIIQQAKAKYPDAIFISAQKRIRIKKVKEEILRFLENMNYNNNFTV
jgi:GTP-binding protein HflX